MLTSIFPVSGPHLDSFQFPDDQALLVVGDVHGQSRALEDVLRMLGEIPTPGLTRTLVFLGDLIDRGPDSLGAMVLALDGAGDMVQADTVVHLPGNHELLFADAVDDPWSPAGQSWLMNGGMSFLIEALGEDSCTAGSEQEVISRLLELMPHPGHDDALSMIRSWPSHFRMGDALCVHAGVAPRQPLANTLDLGQDQHFPPSRFNTDISDRHWAWIRDPFLSWQGGWEDDVLILHGHTIPAKLRERTPRDSEDMASILMRMETNSRICLDGGAAAGAGVAGAVITASGVSLAYATA